MSSFEARIFKNYIDIYPNEMERIYSVIEYIIVEGIGGDMLDKITKKSFRDSNEDYINRLRKEINNYDENWEFLYSALVKWYGSWGNSYKNLRDESLANKFKEKPLHIWLHCLLAGRLDFFRSIVNDEIVMIEKTIWEDTMKKSKMKNLEPLYKGEVKKNNLITERMTRLMNLYDKDEELKVKELLYNKKVAIFNESKWTEKQIEKVIKAYHLASLEQFSALNVTSGHIGDFDFYIFITTQAKHSAKHTLESKVTKDKVFLIHNNNEERVMEEWTRQLKGKIKVDD